MFKRIFLEIDARCGNKCPQCYLKDKCAFLKLSQALIRVEQIRPLCEEFIFIWGEILNRPKYLKIISSTGNSKLGIPTTGLPLLKNPKLVDELVKHGIKEVRISAHYFGQELKLMPLDICLVPKITSLLRESRIRTDVHTILWSGNYNKVAEILASAIDDGVGELRFLNLLPTNKSLGQYTLSFSQRLKVFEQVEACRQKIPKETLTFYLKGGFGPRPGSPGEKLAQSGAYCPAGKESVYINVAGEVFPCIYLTDKKFCQGNFNGQFNLNSDPLKNFNRQSCFLCQNC